MKHINLYPPGSDQPVATHPDRVEYLKSQGFTETVVNPVDTTEFEPELNEVEEDGDL